MASSKANYLFPIVLMMIGTVRGRWLDVSDGVVHDINNIDHQNLPFLKMGTVSDDSGFYGSEKRCESIYGFLPCADTVLESVFLIVMYTYALMLGEEWLRTGSRVLFMHFRNKKIAGSVFRVLMALPRVFMVIVSGVLCTESDARNQVAFGVSMYAGSTVISLTGIWGVNVILNKEKLRGTGQPKPSEQKLSFFKDVGVNINDDTRTMALIMLLSLIPFVVVLLIQVFSGHMMILFALIVSTVSLVSYIAYQIANPWIQDRSVLYLKQERFQRLFLMRLQRLTNENLYIKDQPNMEAIESIFSLADVDQSGHLTRQKLKKFIHEKVIQEEDGISKEYALEEILRHFDTDGTEGLTMNEFKEGCISWLNKWNAATDDLSSSQTNFYENFVVDNKIKELAVMPRILLQHLINKMTLNENGELEESEIEELFHRYDKDKDGEINSDELEKAIAGMNMAKQDPGASARSIINKFDTNESGRISKEEVITGLKKWSKMAKEPASGSNALLKIIQRFATEAWGFRNSDDEPETEMLYVVLGAATIYLFAGPFIQSVIQFSNALSIPFLFTSFVVAPLFMNARSMVIFAFSRSRKDNSNKNASLVFFELYSGLVMNNLMGLTALLAIVYIRGLTWDYTPQVMTIIMIGLIMGTFARFRQTYPLWTSFLAFFLYVTTTIVFCVYDQLNG